MRFTHKHTHTQLHTGALGLSQCIKGQGNAIGIDCILVPGRQLCDMWNCGLGKHFIIWCTAQHISQHQQQVVRGSAGGLRLKWQHFELPCKRVLQHDRHWAQQSAASDESVTQQVSPLPFFLSLSRSLCLSVTLGQTANDFAVDSCLLPFGEFSVNYGCNKLYNIKPHSCQAILDTLLASHIVQFWRICRSIQMRIQRLIIP